MTRFAQMLAALATCCLCASAVGNLVPNGDFSSPLKPMWYGGSFGGGEGCTSIRAAEDGNSFARLEKSKGPGGAQLLSKPVPLSGARRFRLSMRFRANSALAFVRYRTKSGGKWSPVKGPTGREVSVVLDTLLKGRAADGAWNDYAREFVVPKVVRESESAVVLQFQTHALKNGATGFFELDDIAIEPLADEAAVDEGPRVALVSRTAPLAKGYSPVEKVFPWKWEIKNGLLYRNGRPFFFCGWGNETGGGMEGAAGLWLARLQGVRFIGTYLPLGARISAASNGMFEASSGMHPGWISWQREASRLGMLTEPHPLASYSGKSPLGRFVREHPEWKGIYFDLGHYLAYDTGTPLACDILTESRRHYFGHTFPNCGTDYCELAREPGPENCNARMLEAFRRYARGKYGDDLGLANRVWKTDFPDWESVRPLHLDADDIAASAHALELRRHVRGTRPEHYWDFLRFMQVDSAFRTRAEFAAMRRSVPGLPLTIDLRAHHAYTDGYCTFDPELIAPLEDICHVHHGYRAATYNQSPWHEDTLAASTAYPFFAYGYMTRNTDRPVVQSEDIVSKTVLPGSDAEAMAENDFAGLHRRPWKFHIEGAGEDGISGRWFAPDFDDSRWGEVKVPGAWDDQPAYKGRSGVGWYRVRFRLDGRLMADYLDGSRRFLVCGKGVAQRGTLWLNGERVGDVEGWSSEYSFDVGARLRYGGENEIVWRVEGDAYQNGLRFFCHVLCEDMLNHARPFGERQYAQMYWTYMMRGTSGVLNWNWHDDRLMPYLPKIIAPLETAAAVALEAVRSRRSKVAYLYGYLAQRGLPFAGDSRHREAMKWYNAVEFLGMRPDIVSERTFVREVTPSRYPLLVVPETWLVADKTYERFKRYLADGGTAVITTNAFRRTFSRFEPTDVDRLQGRVFRVPPGLPMAELMNRLKPLLPPPDADMDFAVESGERREIPLIERMLAGGDDAKVLYLNNWGGFDHPLTVTLPPSYASWCVTPLRGDFSRDSNGRLSVVLPSQDVAACLLTRGAPEPWMNTGPSAANSAAWERLQKLNAGVDTGRPKALWAGEMHLYPYLLDRLDAFGYDSVMPCAPEKWTDETLSGASVVVIAEGGSRRLEKALRRKDFAPMLRRWVEGGGSLLVMAFSAGTINAYGNVLRKVTNEFGLNGAWMSVAKDGAHAGLGDAWQILSDDVAGESPVTEGVRQVQLFTLTPMKPTRGSRARAAVRIPSSAEAHPGELAMATVELGRGRVFVSADSMFCQPMRIELADNAALLENVVGWLASRPVTQEMREEFKAGLFIGEDCLR